MRARTKRAHTHDVCVWLASRPEDGHESVLPYLDDAERARYGAIRREKDRARFAIGRALTKHALSRTIRGTDPQRWSFEAQPNGKPRVVSSPTHVEFNIAHAGDVIVAAVDTVHPVGIDVERLDDPIQIEPIQDVLSDRDRRKLKACAPEERAYEFRRLWTIKEAYAKRSGNGVGTDFAALDFDWQPRKSAQRIPTDSGVIETRTIDTPTGVYGIAVASESLSDGVLSIRSIRVNSDNTTAA